MKFISVVFACFICFYVYVCAYLRECIPVQARREHQIPELELQRSYLMWVLGIKLGSLEEQPALLITKLSLQPLHMFS